MPPARRQLLLPALALLALVVSACGAPCSETQTDWHIVASGVQGVIVADESTIRGFDAPGGQPTWQHEGWLTGAACLDSCASAYLTFDDQSGLFLARRGSLVRQDVPDLVGEVKVLAVDGRSAVVWNLSAGVSRVLVVRDSSIVEEHAVPGGTPLWFAGDAGGMLFLVQDGSVHAIPVHAVGDGLRIGAAEALQHGVVCMDGDKARAADPPDSVYDTFISQLTQVSLCFRGPGDSWIGISAYIATGPENTSGEPTLAVAGVHGDGRLAWTQTAPGEAFALSQGSGAHLYLSSEHGMTEFDSSTGEALREFGHVADAAITGDGTLVMASQDGSVAWDRD